MRYICLSMLFLVSGNLAADAVNVLQDQDALDQANIIYLEQNWTDQERQFFYFADQGSRYMYYDIFLNLEQAENNKLFREPSNMLRFGYIPVPPSKANPDGLPIGFSRKDNYVGFTCSSCHTQQLKYNGKFIRIDGGQAMADMSLFLAEMEHALEATMQDTDKYVRLEQKVLTENASKKEREVFKSRLKEQYNWQKEYNRSNHTEVPYGYSRVDAVGRILNKGLSLTGVKDNFNPPNAPVSYPYLWDTPQHDYVEWDGAQANSDIGALARNVGEAIGVFGDVTPKTKKWLYYFDGGYESSLQLSTLRKLEKTVSKLYSPLWPEIFPPVEKQLAQAGRPLYVKYCLACHNDINRTDPDRKIKARMSTLDFINTDPMMAKNVLDLRGKTGIFKGKKRFYAVGEVLGEEAPALYIVNHVMVGVLKNNPVQVLLAKRDANNMGHPEVIHPPKYVNGKIIEPGQEVSERALLAYKARPLNGIWAGGPFLHNGSVPNLYQLMLPASQRDKTFYIGAWEFDPVNVGYVTDKRPGSFFFDTSLPGNSNAGHEYGTGTDGLSPLTETEIWALIEYMKTL